MGTNLMFSHESILNIFEVPDHNKRSPGTAAKGASVQHRLPVHRGTRIRGGGLPAEKQSLAEICDEANDAEMADTNVTSAAANANFTVATGEAAAGMNTRTELCTQEEENAANQGKDDATADGSNVTSRMFPKVLPRSAEKHWKLKVKSLDARKGNPVAKLPSVLATVARERSANAVICDDNGLRTEGIYVNAGQFQKEFTAHRMRGNPRKNRPDRCCCIFRVDAAGGVGVAKNDTSARSGMDEHKANLLPSAWNDTEQESSPQAIRLLLHHNPNHATWECTTKLPGWKCRKPAFLMRRFQTFAWSSEECPTVMLIPKMVENTSSHSDAFS